MPDSAVRRFKITGEVAIWRYARAKHVPGWHLSMDDTAGRACLELFDLMEAARYPSRKTWPVSRHPRLTGAPGCAEAPLLARSLEIRFSREDPSGSWVLSEADGAVVLAVGSRWLAALRQGIEDILRGEGDYAIGEEPQLWFWWVV